MKTDRLGGTTYTFSNLNDFLANRAQTIQYLGDLSEPSVFNNGATGERHAEQEYYIGFAQDEWRARARTSRSTTACATSTTRRCARRDNLIVQFDIDNGMIEAAHDAALPLEEEQLPAARRR